MSDERVYSQGGSFRPTRRGTEPRLSVPPEEPGIERLAEAVHEAYLETCARLNRPVKPENRVPYAELSEDSKELDRASARAVLRAASPLPEEPPYTPPLDEEHQAILPVLKQAMAEEPPELQEMLDHLLSAYHSYCNAVNASTRPMHGANFSKVRAANAALVAIYERQSEALEMFRDEQSRDKAQVASLSSQLERLAGEQSLIHELYTEVTAALQECCQRYKLGLGGEQCHQLVIAELERLKAEQVEPEEAQALVDYIDGDSHSTPQGWFDTAYEKLRRAARMQP